MVLVVVGVVTGTWLRSDQGWPFAPMSQFAFAVSPSDGEIHSRYLEATTVDGERVRVDLSRGALGLARAEIEGQLWSFRQSPRCCRRSPCSARRAPEAPASLVDLMDDVRLVSGGVPGRPARTSSSRGPWSTRPIPWSCHERSGRVTGDRAVSRLGLPGRRWPASLGSGRPSTPSSSSTCSSSSPTRSTTATSRRPFIASCPCALLHLPQPSPAYGWVLLFVILVSAAVAASGRLPRLAGWVCAVAMLDWVSNGMSYGKVDHDHFALVVALFVLPTVGRAEWFEGRRTEPPAGRSG